MKLIFTINFFCTALCLGELKLEQVPRLNTSTALKILNACHKESLQQNVDVGIVVVGIDGRILASSKSEKMDPGLYDFAKFKAQTSYFKGVATEDLPARNGQNVEIINIGTLKVIRGVKGGIPLYYKSKIIGAIGVSGANPDIDKIIALKGIKNIQAISDKK